MQSSSLKVEIYLLSDLAFMYISTICVNVLAYMVCMVLDEPPGGGHEEKLVAYHLPATRHVAGRIHAYMFFTTSIFHTFSYFIIVLHA